MTTQEEIEKQWTEQWETIWKPCLYNDKGELDIELIKAEMHDLVFIYEQVGEVYMALTGGMLSKPMYYATAIITEHEDQVNKAVEDFKDEMLEDIKDMDKEEIVKYLKGGE